MTGKPEIKDLDFLTGPDRRLGCALVNCRERLNAGIEEMRNGKYCVPTAIVSLGTRGCIPKNVQGMHA